MQTNNYTLSTPSFFKGFARVLDLHSTLDIYDINLIDDDCLTEDIQAIRSDWVEVGKNIEDSIKQYEQKTEIEK